MTTSPLITHRPYGIGHPYATSPDQRIPILPLVGKVTRLGVQVDPSVTHVTCQWQSKTAELCTTTSLKLTPAQTSTATAAALPAERDTSPKRRPHLWTDRVGVSRLPNHGIRRQLPVPLPRVHR